jgi:4-hydroxy-tetrahydrodipicolinate reductase
MKIALVGFGKMGHMIKTCAEQCGHEVVATIDPIAQDASVVVPAGDSEAVARAVKSSGAEGIIEFSHPSAVMANIHALLPLGIPLVVGTTGWNDKISEVEKLASEYVKNQEEAVEQLKHYL